MIPCFVLFHGVVHEVVPAFYVCVVHSFSHTAHDEFLWMDGTVGRKGGV